MTLKLDAKSGDYTATCALNKRKYFLCSVVYLFSAQKRPLKH